MKRYLVEHLVLIQIATNAQAFGEQTGEQIHPNEAGSPHLKALAPICKLLGRLKRVNRGRLSKPPLAASPPTDDMDSDERPSA